MEAAHEVPPLFEPTVQGIVGNFIVLILLILSYVPQIRRIISRQSTYGLSPYSILLLSLYSTANVAQALISADTIFLRHRCKQYFSSDACILGTLPVWHAVIDWIFRQTILFLYLRHHLFDRLSPAHLYNPSKVRDFQVRVSSQRRISWLAFFIGGINVYCFCQLLLPAALFITTGSRGAIGFRFSSYTTWRIIHAAIPLLLSVFCYLPQVFFTWKFKRAGSLSMWSVHMQVPVYMLLAISSVARLGTAYHTSAGFLLWDSYWINKVTLAGGQWILLTLCMNQFSAKNRGNKLEEDEADAENMDDVSVVGEEQAPLLSDIQ